MAKSARVNCYHFPFQKQRSLLRCLMLLGGGLSGVYLSRAVYCPGTGALGCLIMAAVAAFRWRQEDFKDGRVNSHSSYQGTVEKTVKQYGYMHACEDECLNVEQGLAGKVPR